VRSAAAARLTWSAAASVPEIAGASSLAALSAASCALAICRGRKMRKVVPSCSAEST
jgi:hypothetical protein